MDSKLVLGCSLRTSLGLWARGSDSFPCRLLHRMLGLRHSVMAGFQGWVFQEVKAEMHGTFKTRPQKSHDMSSLSFTSCIKTCLYRQSQKPAKLKEKGTNLLMGIWQDYRRVMGHVATIFRKYNLPYKLFVYSFNRYSPGTYWSVKDWAFKDTSEMVSALKELSVLGEKDDIMNYI